MRAVEAYLQAEDGVGWFVRRFEPRTRDADRWLVLVHGMSEHGQCYEHVARSAVARGWNVVVPALPGHGRSGGEHIHVNDFSEYVADLRRIFEWGRLVSDKTVIVGHSMGGLISARFVQQFPYCVSAMALISPLLGVQVKVNPLTLALARVLSVVWPKSRFRKKIDPAYSSRNPAALLCGAQDPLIRQSLTAAWYFAMCVRSGRPGNWPSGLPARCWCCRPARTGLSTRSAPHAWLERVGSPDKTLRVLPDHYHELLNELDWANTLADLLDWLELRIRQQAAASTALGTAALGTAALQRRHYERRRRSRSAKRPDGRRVRRVPGPPRATARCCAVLTSRRLYAVVFEHRSTGAVEDRRRKAGGSSPNVSLQDEPLPPPSVILPGSGQIPILDFGKKLAFDFSVVGGPFFKPQKNQKNTPNHRKISPSPGPAAGRGSAWRGVGGQFARNFVRKAPRPQLVTQLFAAEAQAAFAGRKAGLHGGRHFREGEPRKVVHREGQPLIFGELLEQLVDDARQFPLGGDVFRRDELSGDAVDGVGSAVVGLAGKGVDQSVVRLAAYVVDQQVAGDAINPAAEPAGGKIVPRLVVNAQQRFLGESSQSCRSRVLR